MAFNVKKGLFSRIRSHLIERRKGKTEKKKGNRDCMVCENQLGALGCPRPSVHSSSTALAEPSAKREDINDRDEDGSDPGSKEYEVSPTLKREPKLHTKSSTFTLDLGRIPAGEIFHRQTVPNDAEC